MRGKNKKSLSEELTENHNESEQVSSFLQSIDHHYESKQISYGSAMEVLKTIFKASGQQHLFHLVKLRKLWFKEIGGFLARHALPSRITQAEHFEVSKELVAKLSRQNPAKDLLKIVEGLLGREYPKWSAFQSILHRRLGRSLSQGELKLLRELIHYVPKHSLLHLTVYDGSIAQAIQFEEQAYIERFQSMLPDLKLGGIRCKVGDLGKSNMDQSLLHELLSNWGKLVPKNIFSFCRPDHIHRVDKAHTVLIIECESPIVLKRLRLNPGGPWMLRQIKKTFTDLDDEVKKLAFICSTSGKKTSLQFSIENLSNPIQDTMQMTVQKNLLKSDPKLSDEQRVRKIIQRLREKSLKSKLPVANPSKTHHFGRDS